MKPAPEPGSLVSARGREWVVLPGTTEKALMLRPLTGTESERIVLLPDLEAAPPQAARFEAPDPERPGTSADALLLADALRLSLRRGAGPFRSAGRIAFQPRAYQLVPLIMALRMATVRLLVADDVGIGKTIEAGLVLRELWDRGEVRRAAVLAPPHLVEQWTDELAQKFDLPAVAVTAASAPRLERGLPLGQSLFDAHPLTVVSLDYIKADRRRADFRRKCPPFVIVDEAHTCVGGGGRGTTQRYELLRTLADDAGRHLLMLTATPHSGNAEAFDNLLGLIDPAFAGRALEGAARERLARHFVQRRRIDVREEGWGKDGEGRERIFPRHDTAEAAFELDRAHLAFHDAVLDYCLGVTNAAGPDQRRRRIAFWGTLALMRCVGSSPAAALSTLRSRREGRAVEDEDHLETAVFDEEDGQLTDDDLEPDLEDSWDTAALDRLIAEAERLANAAEAKPKSDPKLAELIRRLDPLLKAGARPVVFCRFIATAEAVGAALAGAFRRHRVEVVTGRLPSQERRARVEAMAEDDKRILVATDCLSEGINLQLLFDTVVHYDLSWNPTRHQQREGRVDRFGQPAEVVRSLTLYGSNSAIDGAVLGVILRKVEAIRKATGVSVGMPENREKLSEALMQAIVLRSGRQDQLTLGFDFGEDADAAAETVWRDAEESEKKSRAVFAQRRLRPDEVLPEWRKAGEHLGSAEDVARFVRRAVARLGAPLDEARGGHVVHVHALPENVRAMLDPLGLADRVTVSFDPVPPEGTIGLHRAHPLVAALADSLAEGALEPAGGAAVSLARCGAWRAEGLSKMVTLALVRVRHRIARRRAAEGDFLLAEEIVPAAFEGTDQAPAVVGAAALEHLAREATAELEGPVRARQIRNALARLGERAAALDDIARARARALAEDHDRVRAAAREGATTEVAPVLPPDLVGVWVLLPETVA